MLYSSLQVTIVEFVQYELYVLDGYALLIISSGKMKYHKHRYYHHSVTFDQLQALFCDELFL